MKKNTSKFASLSLETLEIRLVPAAYVAPKTDLKIEVTAPTVVGGQDALVTLKVTNLRNVIARNVSETVTVPAWAPVDRLHTSAGAVVRPGRVTFNLGNVHPGQTVVRTVALDTSSAILSDRLLQAIGSVTTRTKETNYGNNVSRATGRVTAPGADGYILLSGPATVTPGALLNDVVTVGNAGPGTATFQVSYPYDDGFLVYEGSGSANWLLQNGVLKTSVTLAPGQFQHLHTKFWVAADEDATIMRNARIVSSTRRDPIAANNLSNVVTTNVVVPRIDFGLTVNVPDGLKQGQKGSVLVKATNNSNTGGTATIILSADPAGLNYGNLVGTGWTLEGDVLARDVTIGANQTVEFTAPVIVDAGTAVGTELGVSAFIIGDGIDLVPENDADDDTLVVTDRARPTLLVTQQSTGTVNTAMKNQKNVPLLRQELRAVDGDVNFTEQVFVAASGALINAQNYALWADTDGNQVVDTILEKGVNASGGKITFDNITGGGFIIPNGMGVMVEVHGDISASLTSRTLQLGMATHLPNHVQAKARNTGESPAAEEITVTTTTATVYTLRDQGSLVVDQNGPLRRQDYLLGGTLANTVMEIGVTAWYEDMDVTTLRILVAGPGARSIERLELYKVGATTPFASATVGNTQADPVPTTWNGQAAAVFTARTNNGQLIVPQGMMTSVLVRPRMKTDEQGAESGKDVTFVVYANPGANSTAVRARGLTSSNELSVSNQDGDLEDGEISIGDKQGGTQKDIVSAVFKTVLAKVTSVTNASPDANGTSVPTGNDKAIGQFKFTAATNSNTLNGLNKVDLRDFVFTVNATNVLLDVEQFRLYNKADSSTKMKGARVYQNGVLVTSGTVTGLITVIIGEISGQQLVDTVLDSGESATLVLETDIVNSKVDPSKQSSLETTLHLDLCFWADADTQAALLFGYRLGDTRVSSTRYVS